MVNPGAMGATLADGGVNPLTKERVIDADSCKFALAVMTTARLYETSGDWLYAGFACRLTQGTPARRAWGRHRHSPAIRRCAAREGQGRGRFA
ncbi:glutaminase [Methylocella tundrae]|nr:glutaminase [Methylocella tundrae]